MERRYPDEQIETDLAGMVGLIPPGERTTFYVLPKPEDDKPYFSDEPDDGPKAGETVRQWAARKRREGR